MICPEQSDEALVELTLAGDLQAYEKLVLRHQRNVIASAYSVVQDHYAAEDAAQDAFVTAWRKLGLLKCPAKYGPWVCRISANRARNMLACRWEYMDIEQIETIGTSRESDMTESMIVREEQEMLWSIMENLPERTRLAVCLHYFDGMPIKDIAEKMLVSSGTVKWQLHEGRRKLRKELAAMDNNGTAFSGKTNGKEQSTLLPSRIMRSIKEIQLWRLRDNREGFQERYWDCLEEILADLDGLPESEQKYRILADILMEIWDWMPEKQDDALRSRLREAAVKGRNERVMESVIGSESAGLFGEEKISFVLGTQIPFLERHGFVQSLGREWFWLGRAYFDMGDREKGFSAYDKVLSILEPKDVYYPFAMAARQMEKIYQERFGNMTDLRRFSIRASGEEYRFIDGTPRRWLMPSYDTGNCWGPGYIQHIFQSASGCDRYFYIPGLKVGETYTGTDGDTLVFSEEDISVETPCGTFDGCQCWISMGSYKNYYKKGIGLVRQERIDEIGYAALKAFRIEGGEGLLPFCTGNRWTYELVGQVTGARGEEDIQVTYADGEKAVLGYCSYGHLAEGDA